MVVKPWETKVRTGSSGSQHHGGKDRGSRSVVIWWGAPGWQTRTKVARGLRSASKQTNPKSQKETKLTHRTRV